VDINYDCVNAIKQYVKEFFAFQGGNPPIPQKKRIITCGELVKKLSFSKDDILNGVKHLVETEQVKYDTIIGKNSSIIAYKITGINE